MTSIFLVRIENQILDDPDFLWKRFLIHSQTWAAIEWPFTGVKARTRLMDRKAVVTTKCMRILLILHISPGWAYQLLTGL